MSYFDRLVTSHVDRGYEQWRMKHYRHLYQCNSCSRAFETVQPADKCIACLSPVTELNRHDLDLHHGVSRLNYYCHSCRKTYFSRHIRTHCKKCGHPVYQNYPWTVVRRRDRIFLSAFAFSSSLKNMKIRNRIRRPERVKIISSKSEKSGR